MINYKDSSLLTLKDKILERVSQEDIFRKYLPKDMYNFKLGKSYKSPIRNDKHASFSIYIGRAGVLRYKDFAKDQGDCFDFVKEVFNCKFDEALKIVANDFNVENDPLFNIPKKKPLVNINKISIERSPCEFEWEIKDFCDYDVDYWSNFMNTDRAITLEILSLYNVFAIRTFRKKGSNKSFYSNKENPIYMYKINSHQKFYQPLGDRMIKFMGNTGRYDIFGGHLLKEEFPVIAICAGQKDAISIYANTRRSVLGISLNSESSMLTDDQFLSLLSNQNKLIAIYDNDETGRKYSQKLSNEFGIPSIDISKITTRKDISEMFKSGYNPLEFCKYLDKTIKEYYDNKN